MVMMVETVETKLEMKPENLEIGALTIGALTKKVQWTDDLWTGTIF